MSLVARLARSEIASDDDVAKRYGGTWELTLASAKGTAPPRSQTIRNQCRRDGEFSVCRQVVDGQPAALLVFVPDPKTHGFLTFPILPGAKSAQALKLIIAGNVWTYPWEETDHGVRSYYRVINRFVSADAIEYRRESSNDGLHWTLVETGTERRIQ